MLEEVKTQIGRERGGLQNNGNWRRLEEVETELAKNAEYCVRMKMQLEEERK